MYVQVLVQTKTVSLLLSCSMKTVLIGSGNVGGNRARAFRQNGLEINQIFGRNCTALREISSELAIPYSCEELAAADLYLICVSDNAIAEVSALITNPNCLVAHTSGSLPKEILQGAYRKACFYPMQTFSRNKPLNYQEIPFFIEAENPTDEQTLFGMAGQISNRVLKADYEKRKYIHLTAVFSCNFVNHLFARAKEIADTEEIPFEYFRPLIAETFEKLKTMEPVEAQTGPAVRNDTRVLELHEQLISNPETRQIYQVMNESIKKMYEL